MKRMYAWNADGFYKGWYYHVDYDYFAKNGEPLKSPRVHHVTCWLAGENSYANSHKSIPAFRKFAKENSPAAYRAKMKGVTNEARAS